MLLALLAACPGPRAVAAPDADASEIAAVPDDAPNLRIELRDAPGAASGPDPAAATNAVGTPARLVEAWPSWISVRDPVLVLHFDQPVDAAAILPTLRVVIEGGAPPLRLATPAERARPEVRTQLAGLDPARTASFAFTTPLPLRARVEVSIGDRDSFSFSVHDGLRVFQVGCSSGPVCRPGDALVVRFTTFLRELPAPRPRIHVHPALTGEVEVSGAEIYITGATQAHQTYEVTIPADFEDMYGQALGQAKTFKVRFAGPEPSFDIAGGTATTLLEPTGPRALQARTINVANLQVVVHAARPTDWPGHVDRPVLSYTVPVKVVRDRVVETTIDLAAALPGGLGHAIVEVWPLDWHDATVPRFRTWLQSTRIGIDAVIDATTLLAWTTDLQTGAPLPGVRVELGAATARSDADGLARLALPATRIPVLTATLGKDVAMLADDGGAGFVRQLPAPLLVPVIITDRDVYQPGETVRVRGWLRRWTRGLHGDLEPVPARTLGYTLVDGSGVEHRSGTLDITGPGSFAFTVTLPALIRSGEARLALAAGDDHFVHPLRIADHPQSIVTIRGETGPHIVGGHVDLTATAQTSTGPRAAAALQWSVHQGPAYFSPPGHDNFRFGRPHVTPRTPPVSHHAHTDAHGQHRLRARFTALTIHEPTTVIAEASMLPPGTLAGSAAVTLLVHPASLYVGLRSARRFVAAGEPLVVDTIVTDIAGKRVTGRSIIVRRHAITAAGTPGRALGECRLRSAREPVPCTLDPQGPGPYTVTATVVDEHGRAHDSALTLWAAGEPTDIRPTDPALRVIPDRDHYRIGDTAKVLLLAPFAPAEGLWTLRRDGLRHSRRFRTRGTSTILEIPIDEAMPPGAVLHVQLVGQQARSRTDTRMRPAHAEAEARLVVPHAGRTLDLSFEPASATLDPGAPGHLDITVRGPDAHPVAGAEVTVFIVDETSPAHARLTDLFADFHPDPGTGTTDHRSRHNLVGTNNAMSRPAYPFAPSIHNVPIGDARRHFAVIDLSPGVRLDAIADPRHDDPFAQRGDADVLAVFAAADTLAVFAAAVPTDAGGRARVRFTLPGDLPRYRVLAYATVGAQRFGAAQTTVSRP